MEEREQNELLTRLDERMEIIQRKVGRIEEAVFGNGKPGIRQEVNEATRRINEIELIEKACPIQDVREVLKTVQDRHVVEDDREKEKKARKDREASEFLKFRWLVLATLATTVINLLSGFIQ